MWPRKPLPAEVCCGSQSFAAARSATQFAPPCTPRATVIRYIFQGGAAVARGIWSDNMWSLNRRADATLTLIALASVAGITSVDARGENAAERHEHRSSGGERHGARREAEPLQSHHTYPARVQGVHAAARREASASYAREYPVVNDHRQVVSRSNRERRLVDSSVMGENHVAGGGRVHEVSAAWPQAGCAS
jgi:hypothetical protein